MQTFKQYLTEAVDIMDVDELKMYLKEHCIPACKLMASSNLYFFRGMSVRNFTRMWLDYNLETKVDVVDVRKDRKPRDTPQDVHDILDKWFTTKFNWPARSSGLFVTTSHDFASEYGSPCIIFPYGEVKGVTSKHSKDLTIDLMPDHGVNNLPGGADYWREQGLDPDDVPQDLQHEFILDFLGDQGYSYGPITQEQMARQNEIMLDCDTYLAIAVGDDADKLVKVMTIIQEVANGE